MVKHFVNLVGWKAVYSVCRQRDCVYIDSLTMWLAVRLFCGKGYARHPGSSASAVLTKDGSKLVLAAREFAPKGPCERILAVPFPLVDYDGFVETVAGEVSEGEDVIIGISSPKQNILASRISMVVSSSTIYCIGAVVDDYYSDRLIPGWVRRFRVEWLYRGVVSPKRMIAKLSATISAFYKLMISGDERTKFAQFILNHSPRQG